MLLSYVALKVTVLVLSFTTVVPFDEVALVSINVTVKFHLYFALAVLEQCPELVVHVAIS